MKIPTIVNLKHGFQWRNVTVERLCQYNGYLEMRLTTPKQTATIRITPSGIIQLQEIAYVDA